MSCEDGTVEQTGDGHLRKCIGGTWVLLPTPPVRLGPGAWPAYAVESKQDLEKPEILAAIKDEHQQVVVQIVPLSESAEQA
jgi:hypothetical protein